MTQVAEARGSQLLDQPQQPREPLSPNKKLKGQGMELSGKGPWVQSSVL